MSNYLSVHSTKLNPDKSFAFTALLTIAGAILIFILSTMLLNEEDFIGSVYEHGVPRALAGFVLLAFPYIHQRLEGKKRSNLFYVPEEAVPLDRYTLPARVVFTYGVLIAFALAGLSLFLVWLVGLVTGVFFTRLISTLSWMILLLTFYYVGFWSGTRSTKSPFLTASGAVLGYSILEILISILLGIDSPLRGLLGLLTFLIPFLIATLVGARSGQRRRLSNYVQYLITPLPEEVRQTLVDHLYREVKQQSNDER